MPRLATFLALMLAGAGAMADPCASLRAEHAWVREPPPAASAIAAYFDLLNAGSAAVTLAGFASDEFGWTMAHDSRVVDGKMEMRPLGVVEIEPGERFRLAPGGAHLMLGEPRKPVTAGAVFRLRVQCEGGGELAIDAPVSRTAPP